MFFSFCRCQLKNLTTRSIKIIRKANKDDTNGECRHNRLHFTIYLNCCTVNPNFEKFAQDKNTFFRFAIENQLAAALISVS